MPAKLQRKTAWKVQHREFGVSGRDEVYLTTSWSWPLVCFFVGISRLHARVYSTLSQIHITSSNSSAWAPPRNSAYMKRRISIPSVKETAVAMKPRINKRASCVSGLVDQCWSLAVIRFARMPLSHQRWWETLLTCSTTTSCRASNECTNKVGKAWRWLPGCSQFRVKEHKPTVQAQTDEKITIGNRTLQITLLVPSEPPLWAEGSDIL